MRVTPSLVIAALALLGMRPPVPITAAAPQIFAPGVVSGPANDGSPTFTPDGRTLFFTRSGANAGFILESHLTNGAWTAPTVAPFSGQWNDQHPTMAPDGSYLIFVSTRPAPGISEKVAHLWRVNRTGTGWGEPTHLPDAVNIGTRIFAPSVAADGSIYFLSISANRAFQLYRSRFMNNAYEKAERLPFSDSASADVDPEIAPDQSFLVFASAGRIAGDSKEHLYIVFTHDGSWGDVTPLRYTGDDDNGWSTDNEPNLGPDRRTLYFSSDRTVMPHLPRTRAQGEADLARIEQWDNGNTNVWSLSLAPFLDAKR
jgi:Tol biopolymer transport system component